VAVIEANRQVAFADLDRDADRFASALLALGMREGDRVVLDRPAAETRSQITTEDRGFFRDDDEREDGRMLNRAFSGTYER